MLGVGCSAKPPLYPAFSIAIVFGMRETSVLALVALTGLFGFFLGCALRPKVDSPTVYAAVMRENSDTPKSHSPVTKVALEVAPPELVDVNSSPEAVRAWHRQEKDEIVRRVENLAPTEAENLCFHLRLIPRDEVFDKINAKGRLRRYIDGLRTDAELADVESGFRDLDEHH